MAKTVTAATVRAYFRADEKRMAALKSDAARHTVAEGARGRLHPEVIKAYNAKRRTTARYAEGANAKVKEAAETNRKVLAEAGIEVGKRGPLSKEAKAYLAQNK